MAAMVTAQEEALDPPNWKRLCWSSIKACLPGYVGLFHSWRDGQGGSRMGTGACDGGRGEELMETSQHFNCLIQQKFRGHLLMYHIYTLEAEWRHRHSAYTGHNRYTKNKFREEKSKLKMRAAHVIISLLWHRQGGLTEDEDLCAGLHWGYAVWRAALPLPLVVLDDGLQQQRSVGLDGIRNSANKVDLEKTLRPFMATTEL